MLHKFWYVQEATGFNLFSQCKHHSADSRTLETCATASLHCILSVLHYNCSVRQSYHTSRKNQEHISNVKAIKLNWMSCALKKVRFSCGFLCLMILESNSKTANGGKEDYIQQVHRARPRLSSWQTETVYTISEEEHEESELYDS